MKCNKCGANLRIIKAEYRKNAIGDPVYKNYLYCDTCKTKTPLNDTDNSNTNTQNTINKLHSSNIFMYDKFYLSSWVISACFALSFLIIPFFTGLGLLILQTIENNKLKKKYGNINELNEDIEIKEKHLNDLNGEISKYEQQIINLQNEAFSAETLSLVNSLDYSDIESYSSEECKNQLSLLRQEEKELIRNNKATKSTSSNKKINNDNTKQILRCFNAECDNIILSVSVKNIDSLRNKITSSYESLNKIFAVDGTTLTKKMLEYKLKELTLIHSYEKKRAEEREIQKAIKEQMLEEERVRKELEKRKQEIEKDQKQFSNEVSKLMKYLHKTENDIEKQLYADKIRELEEKIKVLEGEKADVINREQNAKAGFVYIISNIGSFGQDVYKIGMTRRLEPLDRIKELSSASVPFEFDVHAMIFSEDAPGLESSLHQHFNDKRVNKINSRKEFFNISIDEIEEFIDETFDKTVEFTKIPVAQEYRDSLALID